MKLKVNEFRVQCARRNVSGAAVARHIGYSKQWLHAIKRDFVNIQPEIAKKMADFLVCEIKDIFEIEK